MASVLRMGITTGSLGLNLSKKNKVLNDSWFYSMVEKRYSTLREKLISVSRERIAAFPDLDGKGFGSKLKWTAIWLKEEASYIYLTHFAMKMLNYSQSNVAIDIFHPIGI